MEFKKIGVLGTGQMGAGICQVAAAAGCEVLMADLNIDIVKKALGGIEKRLGKAVAKGRMEQAAVDKIMANLHPVEGIADFKDVDIAIEAATENIDLKLKLFKGLDEAIKPEAILASNTSSISITLMAAATSRPDKVVGMHFMNPVPVMKLVEMIPGLQTDDAVEFYRKLGFEAQPEGLSLVSGTYLRNETLTD